MSEKIEPNPRNTRRKLLAFLGLGAVSLTSIFPRLSRWHESNDSAHPEGPGHGIDSNTSNGEDQNTDGNTEKPDSDEYEGRVAENIEEYGGIEGDESIEAAERNVDAIHRASVAAENSTVYLPEGQWYVGDRDVGWFLYPGNEDIQRGDSSLGFVGEGPTKSFLIVSPEVTKTGGNQIRYGASTLHYNVEWTDLTYDGNESEIGLTKDGSQWAINILGDGDFTFDNVRFRNFHANGIRGTSSGGYSIDIDHCTFYNTALGRHNNRDGEMVGHHITCSIDAQNHLTVTNTRFELVSGTCLNLSSGTRGPVTIENCWAKGSGNGFIKVTNGGLVEMSHLYFQGASEELSNELNTSDGIGSHHGRWFIYRLTGDVSNVPKFVLNNVEVHATPYHSIEVRRGYRMAIEGGDGGPIVFYDSAGYDNYSDAIVDDSDEESKFLFDISELSVHDISGNVFSTPSSEGTIETLTRGTDDDLGETGNVVIEIDQPGVEPYEPDVPTVSEVGIVPNVTPPYARLDKT